MVKWPVRKTGDLRFKFPLRHTVDLSYIVVCYLYCNSTMQTAVRSAAGIERPGTSCARICEACLHIAASPSSPPTAPAGGLWRTGCWPPRATETSVGHTDSRHTAAPRCTSGCCSATTAACVCGTSQLACTGNCSLGRSRASLATRLSPLLHSVALLHILCLLPMPHRECDPQQSKCQGPQTHHGALPLPHPPSQSACLQHNHM